MGSRKESPAERLRRIKSASPSTTRPEPTRSRIPSVEKPSEKPIDIKKYPATVIFHDDGRIKEINVSATLIKQFYLNGVERDICPQKLYVTYITGEKPSEVTYPMLLGNFFETLAIGEGNQTRVTDLPKKAGDKPTVDELRIREQATLFSHQCEKYGIFVIKESSPGQRKNVQIPSKKEYEAEKAKERGFKVFLTCVSDLISPVSAGKFVKDMMVIDIKLTKDRESTWGEFGWGDPASLDHTQAVVNSLLTGLPFAYWVWDYKKEDRGHKFVPVTTLSDFINVQVNDNNRAAYNKAVLRLKELKINVVNTVEKIVNLNFQGWPKSPTASECKTCPLSPQKGGNCKESSSIESV